MSIRLRLFLILIAATCAVWMSAVLWIESSTRAEVERVLDARLAESANMVSSLISNREIAVAAAADRATADRAATDRAATFALSATADFSRQLSCQIWSLRGDLVGASSGAPVARLAENDGFSKTMIDGETWRVYAVHNAALGVRVFVGDRMTVRDRLVYDVVGGLLRPALLVLPLLAILIWVSVGRGLAPLDRLEHALRTRRPADLGPLPEGPTPREIRPVLRALNGLFARLDRVRRSERDFTAFAAHELKTPLAGLRTQAEIAAMAPDRATRDRALAAITASVDRTDRIVRQLLDLATVEGDETATETLGLRGICADVGADLGPMAAASGVSMACDVAADLAVAASRFLLHAALRNIVENAIVASPPGGRVAVAAARDAGGIAVTVSDEGPGIAREDRDRVTERFYRGRNAVPGGSGLGLAIAAAALERLGGRLAFPETARGQRVELWLPVATGNPDPGPGAAVPDAAAPIAMTRGRCGAR